MTIQDLSDLQEMVAKSPETVDAMQVWIVCLLAEVAKELKIFNQTLE